jgi:hypothetical protein
LVTKGGTFGRFVALTHDEKTKDEDMSDQSVAQIASEYLRLGGTRKAIMDDNLASTRKWESEPAAAKTYWDSEIASLDNKRKAELVSLLPSINSDK